MKTFPILEETSTLNRRFYSKRLRIRMFGALCKQVLEYLTLHQIHFNSTSNLFVNVPTAIANAGLTDTYFDETSRIYIEAAVPRTKGTFTNNLRINDDWNRFLRNSYFGEVEEVTSNDDPNVNRMYVRKVVTDLTFSHNFTESVRFTVGANNLFDVYPDESDESFRSSGRFIYSRRATQFGTGGRHVFARLNISLK